MTRCEVRGGLRGVTRAVHRSAALFTPTNDFARRLLFRHLFTLHTSLFTPPCSHLLVHTSLVFTPLCSHLSFRVSLHTSQHRSLFTPRFLRTSLNGARPLSTSLCLQLSVSVHTSLFTRLSSQLDG